VDQTPAPLLITLCLPGVERSFFSIRAEGDGRLIRVLLSGTADLRSHTALESFLATLHRETLAAGADEVRVDVRNVEFMSSACFRLVLAWVSKVVENAQPYRISFFADTDSTWQRRSMEALSSFAGPLVSVTTTGPS
jgi:hypothetical protein